MATFAPFCFLCFCLSMSCFLQAFPSMAHEWPRGGSTRIYDFKVRTLRVAKLCNAKEIVTINKMFPGPVVYAEEDDRIIVKVTNEIPTMPPFTVSHSSWPDFHVRVHDGEAERHLFLACHVSWLRTTVYGAIVVYPKAGVPYPFKHPYEEHIVILDVVQLEQQVLAKGGAAPPAYAFTINGHPGPYYNCSKNVGGPSPEVNTVAPNSVHPKPEWTAGGIALLIGKHGG
ncbi:aluminum-activated malate transporter 10 [Hibiscus syriacus]|uniref:Aluminum-activated malate transporter 10 n=1 Tax=Hibiscus syriacus TaxID=106335 RepID=A0A6A3CIA5_HIBSY|nr:aluminum-activated malate transporter 10 [Hibiscus syriacus]